jgi:hypothetical protein
MCGGRWTKQLRNREKKNPNTFSLFAEKGNTVPEVDTIIIVIAINKSSLNADLAFTTTTTFMGFKYTIIEPLTD